MERIGALETICRYPVKSMAGEELDEAWTSALTSVPSGCGF
jgi:uncharacterized protein YcbX